MKTILIDTREQHPLNFSFYGVETCRATLKYGDYSLKGYESLCLIERKASTGELYGNLVKNFDRFCRELEKAKDCVYKYIICEFHESDMYTFPKGSGIPFYLHRGLNSRGSFFRKRACQIQEDYGVVFVFCGDAQGASEKVIEIFKEIEHNEKI